MRFAAALLTAVATAVLSGTALAFASGGLRPAHAWAALAIGSLLGAITFVRTKSRSSPVAPTGNDAIEISHGCSRMKHGWSWRRLLSSGSETPISAATPRPCPDVIPSAAIRDSSVSIRGSTKSFGPRTVWEWAAIVAFALFALRAFLWLVFTDGDVISVLSPNNLGDLSLHLTYIRHLASGVPFWPENPIFTGGSLIYPVGVDLFNSLLLLAGVDVLRGLIWVGLGGAALTGIALWRWGRGFALVGFLANGGLAGFAFFSTLRLEDFQTEFAWKSLPLALLVTQRGLLFALPAGLLLLTSWRSRYFGGDVRDRLPWLCEWLLYAALPIFHLHTFLFLSLVLAAWFVTHAEQRKALATFVGAAFLPATMLTMLVTGGLRGASVLGWKPGWMWDDDPWIQWCATHVPGSPSVVAALLFWPMNFGVLPVFVALLCWRMRRGPGAAAAFVWPALAIFLLCCFVKFAPWEWDNTKLMLWSYVAVLPFLWSEVLSRWPLWARALSCFALFWSGFTSLLGGLDATHTGHEIARRSEVDAALQAVRNTPPNARFAGYPTYNHPLLLAGRAMALGYPGHLWSHGLPYQDAEPKLEALMNGEPAWRSLAAELHVRYLFFGPREREHYPVSAQPWKESAALIAHGEWGELYDLTQPVSPTAPRPTADAPPVQ